MRLRIAVAMSGGVDSTAAALILKAQGNSLTHVSAKTYEHRPLMLSY